MVFSSIEFLWFFMPAVLVLYALTPPGARNALLATASVVFYAWGAHAVVYVFLISVGLNYSAGRAIEHYRTRDRDRAARIVMIAAIAVDLGFLFVWKYTVFAATQLDRVLGGLGHPHAIAIPSITLPIGISFFTFHAISYVVDTARGVSPPMRRLQDFAQYMAFFPQLIAGPIVRYHQIDAQIRHPPPRSQRLWDFADGFPRFAWGLSKKVLVADQVGRIADAAFANTHGLGTSGAWLGALAYTVQIYFDFSGYSDMALGMARMFGFRFPENFNRPYSSLSITDFWRRWHMTLSGWFRDYVYVPLGGNRGTLRRTARNLLFVFLLTGLWHGAAWTFVLWGLYHGVIIVLERLTGYARLPEDRLVAPRRALALLLVILGWVLFRAHTLGDAGRVYAAMLPWHFHGLPATVHTAVTRQTISALAIGIVTVLLPRGLVVGRLVSDAGWSLTPLLARAAVLVPLPLAAIYVAAGSFSPFLYFRF
ncbi:MAG TPA: MBOAT family protein [Solirubrobacteraceae bacterium]|nr:MBOAT family protein [Solirubrobacteraceae bacterium]